MSITASLRLIPADQVGIVVLGLSGTLWLCCHAKQTSLNTSPPDIEQTIDLNTATVSDLDLLEGIGPALSARIISDRDARGPFSSVERLQRVKGIGPKTLEKNLAYLRADQIAE